MSVESVAIIAASSVTALGGLGYVGKRLWNALKLLERAAALLFGDEMEGKPSLDRWQYSTDLRLDSIERELSNNGGSSVKDKIDAIALHLGITQPQRKRQAR